MEVVQDHHHGQFPLLPQGGDEFQEFELVAQVQEGRRLVQQYRPRSLSDRHRHPHALPFSSGESLDRPIRETGQIGQLECFGDRLRVLRTSPSEQGPMRMPSQHHEFADREPGRGRRCLRQHGKSPGAFPRWDPGPVHAIQADHPGEGWQQAPDGVQEGGLPAAVRADEPHHGTIGDIQVQIR
jgi:hypothetical protein